MAVGDRKRAGRGERLLACAVIALGAWLRIAHLGTPSLWWDEIVHVRTAERPTAELLGAVKWGISPTTGNAGAMPLDDLVLHAWLRATPRPAPERLEVHLRTPACLWSILAIAAQWALVRRLHGPAAGLLAALLLATSLPAILYAVEARPYSLLVLASIAQLSAFAAVDRAPRRTGARVALVAATVGYVCTGILAIFVVAAEDAVIGVRALARRTGWAALVGPALASAAAVAAILAWMSGIPLGARFARTAWITPWSVTRDGLRFLSGGSSALLVFLPVAVPLAVRAERRRGGSGAVSAAAALAFAALPATAVVVSWKSYYFHGRHALFLLPFLHLLVAGGAMELLRAVDPLRRRFAGHPRAAAVELAVAVAAVAAVAGPVARAWLVGPEFFLARTKSQRDTRAVAAGTRAALATLPPGGRYLLLAERDSVANATLRAYLQWWDLDDRVALRSPGTGIPLDRATALLRDGGGDPAALALRPAFGLTPAMRRFVGIDGAGAAVPRPVRVLGLVAWREPLAGSDVQGSTGVRWSSPRAITPAPAAR